MLLSALSVLAAPMLASAAALQGSLTQRHGAQNGLFGYLFANFYSNNEQVFFQLSDGDDPLSYSPINNNKPVLRSTVGAKAVRDPYIAWNPIEDQYWLLGNNQSLVALGIDKGGDFNKAFYANYSGAVLFKGLDNTLTNWDAPCLIDFAGHDSLHVFAPEAIWDTDKNAFLLHWSGAYLDATTQKIYGVYTVDFRTFSQPFVYYEEDRDVGDMTVAAVDESGKRYVRFWQSQEFGGTVRGQWSQDGLNGPWTYINSTQTPNATGSVLNPGKGGSAITVYKDNHKADTFYILVNEAFAQVPYQTDTIKVFPYKYADAPNFPRGTSQGTVVNLRRFQHDAIKAKSTWEQGVTPQQATDSQEQPLSLTRFVPLF